PPAPATLGTNPNGGASAPAQATEQSQLAYRMQLAFEKAALGHVPVSTIDVCGLRVPPLSVMTKPTCADGLKNDFLRNVAVGTGGRAVVDTNDFKPGVDAIFRENSSYYLIGYQP